MKDVPPKDGRYEAIKSMIERKSLRGLQHAFSIMTVSLVKKDLKINYNTLHRHVTNPNRMPMKTVIGLASLIEVDPMEIAHLAVMDIERLPKPAGRKK